jgi:hypothetical protein
MGEPSLFDIGQGIGEIKNSIQTLVKQSDKLFIKMDSHETRLQQIEDTHNNGGCKTSKQIRAEVESLRLLRAGDKGNGKKPDIVINNTTGDTVGDKVKEKLFDFVWRVMVSFFKKNIKTIISTLSLGIGGALVHWLHVIGWLK